jgi:hypothetical protein
VDNINIKIFVFSAANVSYTHTVYCIYSNLTFGHYIFVKNISDYLHLLERERERERERKSSGGGSLQVG